MLGETQGTSAGGAEEAGKFLRVPGTNPFFPDDHDHQGNRFLELMSEHQLDVYLMNTGRVGGPDEDDRSLKMRIPHSSAIVKSIAEGTIEWERDPDFGYDVASSVPGIDESDSGVLRPFAEDAVSLKGVPAAERALPADPRIVRPAPDHATPEHAFGNARPAVAGEDRRVRHAIGQGHERMAHLLHHHRARGVAPARELLGRVGLAGFERLALPLRRFRERRRGSGQLVLLPQRRGRRLQPAPVVRSVPDDLVRRPGRHAGFLRPLGLLRRRLVAGRLEPCRHGVHFESECLASSLPS